MWNANPGGLSTLRTVYYVRTTRMLTSWPETTERSGYKQIESGLRSADARQRRRGTVDSGWWFYKKKEINEEMPDIVWKEQGRKERRCCYVMRTATRVVPKPVASDAHVLEVALKASALLLPRLLPSCVWGFRDYEASLFWIDNRLLLEHSLLQIQDSIADGPQLHPVRCTLEGYRRAFPFDLGWGHDPRFTEAWVKKYTLLQILEEKIHCWRPFLVISADVCLVGQCPTVEVHRAGSTGQTTLTSKSLGSIFQGI
ncbi:hypothetical protein C8R47DRAFT_1080517 [Mycena vitilis]|nr:hypothetical protein C8R47DRAFT_1080517 [Mycena vitilis]